MTHRWFVTIAALLALSLGACGEDTPAASGGEPTPAPGETPPTAAPEAAPADEARATWTEETYELTAVATGPFAVGTESSFEVRLTPRGEYHVNVNYPWTVTITPPEAITVPTLTYDGTTAEEITETVARFVVPFTPTAAGGHDVTAAVDFGICRAEACVFEMRNVLVHLEVDDGAAPGEGAAAPAEGAAAPEGETAPTEAAAEGGVVPLDLAGVGAGS